MPREEVFALYPQSICSIIPSRDEPTSMIGIESMMFSRTIISSDMTGIGEVINDGETGFIFHNENSDELSEKIKYVIDHPQEVLIMGMKSRKIYEQNYQMHMFKLDF
jgi:glycosyltransferase involved in cell wall biosynthesis